MKHEITPFNYNGHNLSTITDEQGEVWFIAKDVCSVLEIQNVTQAVASLDHDERSMFKIGRQGSTNVINESGLYSLILNSRKPEAKPFKKWVTSEVLPSIRKTGSYTAQQASTKPKLLPGAAAAFKSMHSIAKLIGLEGNQAVLCANNAVFKHEGVNCLELLGQTALTAEDQRGKTYTATQLGNFFLGFPGKCGFRVNKMLDASGLILRGDDNRPQPTEAGNEHGEWADTGKSHGGAPVKEWRWFDTVVPFIQRSAA